MVLRRQGCCDGHSPRSVSVLPGELKALVRRNALKLGHDRFPYRVGTARIRRWAGFLDEPESSKQSRLRAWDALQRLRLVLSESGNIAIPPLAKRRSARAFVGSEGGFVSEQTIPVRRVATQTGSRTRAYLVDHQFPEFPPEVGRKHHDELSKV